MPADVLDGAAVPPERERGVRRAFHRVFSPLWIAFVAYQWWAEVQRRIEESLPAQVPLDHAHLAAAMGAAGHIAGNAVEALFYMAAWRARGFKLGFARLFEWMVTLSVLDLLSSGLVGFAKAHPGWVAGALEVFVGFGVVNDDPSGPGSGFQAAFGSFGLLCVARIVGTAAVQRQGTKGGLAAPLALTFAVWLVGRLASWWMVDLARGISPLP